MSEKERREQAAFKRFIERRGTTAEWKSIESRKAPEPDLLCVHRTDGEVAVECLSITNNDVAQVEKAGPKARTDAFWTDDSPAAKLRKKLHKKYETTASRIDLLIYIDGLAILPDDVQRPTLELQVNAVPDHPFAQVWFSGESEWCLLWP